MRPKLKAGTFCIPAPDGVHIRSGAQWFKLNGKTTYSWIERLAPHLNGRQSLDELVGRLPEDKRQMVVQIVELLAQHGCVVDYAQDAPHTLSEDEQTAYAAEIAFVESFGGNAPLRFQRFRESRVLLVGAGLTLTALVYAALRCGLRRPTVLVTGECATNITRHAEYLRLLQERDPRLELGEVAAPRWEHEEELAALVGGFDAVLHLSDRPMLGRARLLNRACAARGTPLLQAMALDGAAWLGPLVGPDAAGCWECAWRRLLDNQRAEGLPPQSLRDRPDAALEPFLTATTAALTANTLCFELFKHISTAGPLETAGRMVRIDLETLESQSFVFAPHPLCESCATPETPDDAARAAVALVVERPPVTVEQFSQRAVRCFDQRLGLFSSLDEQDFAQLPLHVAQVRMACPLPGLEAPLTAIGAGLEPGLARRRATQRALELYAGCVFDARRLPQPARAAGGPRPDERTQARLWAYDLHARNAVPVAAEHVFPALRGLAPSEQSMPGLASGLSWDEAVVRGLTGLARWLTIDQLAAAREPFGLVDLEAAPLDEDGARLRAILAIGGGQVRIYDLSGPLGVTVLALTLDGRTIGYSADGSPLAALCQGLELLVLEQQSRAHGQPSYAPPAVPELPLALRGNVVTTLEQHDPGDWAERRQLLLRAFARNRYRALAAPLDHDPLVATILPAVVHVLALREAV
ncbi:MAG: hypothetical protein OHK0022_03610 [Roseiflexaceae bacterium]